MRKILLAFFVTLLSISFLMTDAQAKRFGGGKSFGMARQSSSYSRPNNSYSQASSLPQKPASSAHRWLGPLAGLAMGGLLASLFMGHGLGSGLLSWALLLGGIFVIWSLIRSRLQTPARNQNMVYETPSTQSGKASNVPFFGGGNNVAQPQANIGFDENAFLRNAKSLFIRLQAAYDTKNLNDIREFTEPSVFSEIQLQLQERGNEVNYTEVINIDAEILDLTTEASLMIASVQFTGEIREEQNGPIQSIKEIWHLQKNHEGTVWRLSGIQQA